MKLTSRCEMKRLALLHLLIFLCASSGVAAADFKVLVLGNSQSLNAASEAAFPPSGVASHLREILAADPALAGTAITVTAGDLYQSKSYTQIFTQTLSSRTLMSGYYWPATRAATTALLAQDWDYVVMIEDPYTASRFPEYSFEGVRAIAREVRQVGGQPLLVMTWSSAATTTAKFAEMTYRVGDATGVPVVPAGYAWNNLAAGLKGSGTRPNLQGSYLTAAAIYSRITTRDSATSTYVPAALPQADRDALAATALAAVQAAPGQTHYAGSYTGPTHFAAPLLKKRSFTYTDFNSSTEWGYRGGLSAVLSLARMNWTQTFSGYQSLPTSGYPYDFAQTRDFTNANSDKWKVFGTFDYQDDFGGESMISGVDRVMYTAPLPEQETSAANITARRIAAGTFFVPVRVLWSRLSTAQPAIAAQPDGHHLSDAYNQGVASMMFTLLTGRCGVGSEPGNAASADWQNWYCRKTGYEIAWQYATLQERVPGLEVLPASANATLVTPGSTTTLTVRFLYPPTSDVTVNVSVDSATAATVSPATLIFTPQNYQIARTVTVTGLAGTSAWEDFNVNFSTASSDAVFSGLGDSWAYSTARPASGVWSANDSGTWTDTTKWSGGNPANGTGTADFSSIDITADRTVSLDAPLSVGGLAFGDASTGTAGGWTLDPNGNAANTLTMLGVAPSITVNTLGIGKSVTISAILAGSTGMAKNGPGSLSLSGLNTYTGGTTVNAGTLQLATGGGTGAIRGALTVNSGAAVISSAASSFGYNSGSKIDSLTLNNASLNHTPAGGTLTLASVPINLTGGTMDSTGSAGFDFYDISGNTSVTTLASSGISTIAGIINLRAGDGDSTGTVFTVADGAAVNDLLVSADLTNGQYQGAASVVQKSGAGRMVLSGNNSYSGGTILNAGTLVASSKTALGANSTVTFAAASGAVLELATADGALTNLHNLNMGSNRFNTLMVNRATPGSASYVFGAFSLGSSTMTFTHGANIVGNGSVAIGALDLSAGNNDRPATLGGSASIQVASAAIVSNNSISKRLQLDGSNRNSIGPIANGSGTGILSLIKAGSGTWTLTAAPAYSGETTVNDGVLSLTSPGLANSADVSLSSGSTLDLNFTGTETIRALRINGVIQSPGTWGGISSNASYRTSLITGSGLLAVTSGAAAPPYTSWAAAYNLDAPTGQSDFATDSENDGIPNGLEWILGGNPRLPDKAQLPQVSMEGANLVFTFTRNPASRSTSMLHAEFGSDLIGWKASSVGVISSGPDVAGVSVTVTPNSDAPDTIQVNVPSSNAAGGKLFIRLKATMP
jgi:autotransporter-associated beta strand protein